MGQAQPYPEADPSWMSVDGMIVAASTTLLAESRSGHRGGVLPWALLVAGSVASLAANVAVAEPTATGRVIAARPSFALIASYDALEAKLYDPAGNGVGVRDVARLISRHRQFGVLVTTSYVARQAYQEVRADQHPVVAAADIVGLPRAKGYPTPEAVTQWLAEAFPDYA
jgi:hypothetical protein